MPRVTQPWRVGGDLVDPDVPLADRKQLAELLSSRVVLLEDELRNLTGGNVAVDTDADVVLHGDTFDEELANAKFHRDLIGEDLHIPRGHATSHEQGQTDALSVGTPSAVGVARSAGVASNYARRDHNHGLKESGGTELILGAIADGQALQRSGGAVIGVAAGATSKFVDHIINAGVWDLTGAGITAWTRTSVSNSTLIEQLFLGSAVYAVAVTDVFVVRASTSAGAGAATVVLFNVETNAPMSTITIPAGTALTTLTAGAVTAVPAVATSVGVRASSPAGVTLTVRAMLWGRHAS